LGRHNPQNWLSFRSAPTRDNLGRAYNRTEFVEQRRKMLQSWADYLDKQRTGASVVSLRGRKS